MLDIILSMNIYHFMLIAGRVGGALMIMPGFAATYVSMRVRVLLTLLIALVLVSVLSDMMPPLPSTPGEVALTMGKEITIGLFFGVIARLIVGALHTTGTMIAMTSAMANAFIMDPVSSEQGAIVTSFLNLVAVTLIFVTDMHHLILAALVDTYTLFKPGAALPVADMANVVARNMADAFKIGVQMSGPFLVAAMTYHMSMGLVTRLMPSFPIFFVAMPAQLLAAVYLIGITLAGIMLVFLEHFQGVFDVFLAP